MGETWGMIHPEANIPFRLLNRETRQQVTCFSDTMWDWYRIDIPIPKGRHWKEEGSHGCQAGLNASRANFITF